MSHCFQLNASQETEFLLAARKRIHELFERLAHDGSQMADHLKVTGYIMGYLSILTGHRSVVLTNMTKQNVLDCQVWSDGNRFQVMVDDNKTVRSFGQAAFCLNKAEYGWLQHMSQGKCCVRGQDCLYIFHTSLGLQIAKPANFLNIAWVDAGMKGQIDFNKIRSSVSTQANDYLSEKERRQVAKAMCHDPDTAERFYVALPDKEACYRTRVLRMKALQLATENPSKEDQPSDNAEEALLAGSPDTSSDSDEPTYDDEPDTSSSLSPEEMRIMKRKRGFDVSSSDEEHLADEKSTESVVSPSKCSVVVDRMKPSIFKYFNEKRNTADVPRGCEPETSE
ncbi:uncharacterized protein LOC118121794 [Hippoglossus stenolepis]|uniref:uncharacterized protein LOC118121794 n=1 Tax=Hippoglossus stenolepis TaxID=195615 RepID=UPI001FB005DA|nr:uncharacterized protein LOC118121794 [Hippoglossus stenolepis]